MHSNEGDDDTHTHSHHAHSHVKNATNDDATTPASKRDETIGLLFDVLLSQSAEPKSLVKIEMLGIVH